MHVGHVAVMARLECSKKVDGGYKACGFRLEDKLFVVSFGWWGWVGKFKINSVSTLLVHVDSQEQMRRKYLDAIHDFGLEGVFLILSWKGRWMR